MHDPLDGASHAVSWRSGYGSKQPRAASASDVLAVIAAHADDHGLCTLRQREIRSELLVVGVRASESLIHSRVEILKAQRRLMTERHGRRTYYQVAEPERSETVTWHVCYPRPA